MNAKKPIICDTKKEKKMLVLKTLKESRALVNPQTQAEFEQLFLLRWEILRKPWGLLPGTEQDNDETTAIHRAVFDFETSKILACGRIQSSGEKVAQIRYMAVGSEFQGAGFGLEILRSLEQFALQENWKYIFLNARENALGFYEKCGYQVEADAESFLGIRHFRMSRNL
jgi:predicted GNAT family N-acyltransferase